MNVDLEGPAGLLEAIFEPPRLQPAGCSAVVCHPHPLFGGTMLNKVVYHLARGLSRAGYATLRFNFRGVGRSAGEHDDGRGEADDVRAAMGYLLDRCPGQRLLLAGYSFGAQVASRVLVEDGRAEALLAIGPAIRVASFAHLLGCEKPKVFLVAENDEFGELAVFEPFYEKLREPRELHSFPAEGHSFAGSLEGLESRVEDVGRRLAARALLAAGR